MLKQLPLDELCPRCPNTLLCPATNGPQHFLHFLRCPNCGSEAVVAAEMEGVFEEQFIRYDYAPSEGAPGVCHSVRECWHLLDGGEFLNKHYGTVWKRPTLPATRIITTYFHCAGRNSIGGSERGGPYYTLNTQLIDFLHEAGYKPEELCCTWCNGKSSGG